MNGVLFGLPHILLDSPHGVVRSAIHLISPRAHVCLVFEDIAAKEILIWWSLVGSSSGSAVAVSANIVPIAYGTETDTSIIGPAGVNGVVGIKPTVGLTSRTGIIPISKNLDTAGCFGRTVADAVVGIEAVVDADKDDPMTQDPSHPHRKPYTASLTSRHALKGAKFGLPFIRCWECVDQSRKAVAMNLFDELRKMGAEVLRTDFPCAEERIAPDGSWDW